MDKPQSEILLELTRAIKELREDMVLRDHAIEKMSGLITNKVERYDFEILKKRFNGHELREEAI